MLTLGCLRATSGNCEYYICKMKAGELIDRVGIASEFPEGPFLDAVRRDECDVQAVVSTLVPYIISDPDRFFNSFIVDVYCGFEDAHFESLAKVVPGLPSAYALPMEDMGFVSFPGRERLIALDGQKRLLALRIAIRGVAGLPLDQRGLRLTEEMKSLEPHPELAGEEVCALLIRHTDVPKVQKSIDTLDNIRKPFTSHDRIAASNDDVIAVITRSLYEGDGAPLAPVNGIEIVNWKSNSLPIRSKCLTKLKTLYAATQLVLTDVTIASNVSESSDEMIRARRIVIDFWEELLKGMNDYRLFLELTAENEPVSKLRETNLLLRPSTQLVLAYVYLLAQRRGISWRTVVERLNGFDWAIANRQWDGVLTYNHAMRMISSKEEIRVAGEALAAMVL